MGLREWWNKLWDYDVVQQDMVLLPAPPKPKQDPKKALVHLIKMDMQIYPSEWEYYERSNYKTLHNKKADLKVMYDQLPVTREDGTTINGIQVSPPIRDKCPVWAELYAVYELREITSVLEKVLARVEKVQQVTPQIVQEAKRAELVDPFGEDHLVKIQQALDAIQSVGTSSMMPTLSRSTLPRPTVRPVSSRPQVATWYGKPIDKLSIDEHNTYMKYMENNIGF